jgi:hypothetical protein
MPPPAPISYVFPPVAQPLPARVPEDLVVSMRKPVNGVFGDDIGDTTFMKVKQPYPPYAASAPNQGLTPNIPKLDNTGITNVLTANDWFDAVIQQATRQPPTNTGVAVGAAGATTNPIMGDVVLFIHGFSNDPMIVMQRHGQLRKDLEARGYTGADWPRASQPVL